jgi:hypothetical protein
MVTVMAQKTMRKRPDISGEKFETMEKEQILNSIKLDPKENPKLGEYRKYKGWVYIGGITGISYGDEVVAFQVLYNKMIEDGVITGKKIKEDGKYSSETAAAIKNLQRQINERTGMGILVDGYFGIETWNGTYALLTGDVEPLARVMGKEVKKVGEEEKPLPPKRVEKGEKIEKKEPLEDFKSKVGRLTRKSSPNEKFEWNDAYSEGLYEMGVVEKDDYGNYQLTEKAKGYLEGYNRDQKKDWKVTESSLEEAINDPSKFKNKHAKAVEYIIEKYEEEAGAGWAEPGEGLPGFGEGRGGEYVPPGYEEEELIPREIYAQLTDEEKRKADSIPDIIAKEKDEEAKKKMLAALEVLRKASDYAKLQMLKNDILPGNVRENLIKLGEILVG